MYIKPFLKYSFTLVLFCTYQLSAQNKFTAKFQKSSVYSGIEVGSKGVKMSLLEIDETSKDNSGYARTRQRTKVNQNVCRSPANRPA